MATLELKTVKKEDESVKKLATLGEKLTEAKVEKSLNYDELSKEDKKAIDDFNKQIDVYDTTQILQYGSAAQNKISEFSDEILDDVKTKSAGEVGDLLANLVGQIKNFDSSIDSKNKGFFTKLFSGAKKEVDTIIAKYSKIETNIDKIESELNKNQIMLLKDVSIFDEMYDKNLEYFKEISLYIIAGERKIEELKTKTLPELKKQAEKSNEQLDVQKVQDMEALINRFEKKIYDLKTTRIISIQMAPQIRLLQNNDSELVEKIQSSITNTIPLWKNQIVLALGINDAKKALNAQKEVTNLTNEMLKKNSETLKQGSIEIAKESERAIVDVETLKKTNKDLIDTLDSIIKIHEEGRANRAKAEEELKAIEKELKEKILEINIQK